MKIASRILCGIASIASLSACTSFEPLRPDMEARPLPSRADEVAYINGLRKAYMVDTTAGVPCYTGKDLKPFRPKFVQGYPDWDGGQEVAGYEGQCLGFVANPSSEDMAAYLENGFGLTDLYCQRYFTIATETRQSRKLQRGIFKDAGTLVNAVLTALSVGSNPIGITSAGFSAIDSGYGAVDDAFVVAPTRDDVRKLVLGAQQQFRADVFKPDEKGQVHLPARYPSGRATIERYAGLCTFDGMRQLVADAVKEKTDALNTSAQKTPGQDDGKTPGTETVEGTTPPKVIKPPTINMQTLTAPPPVSPTGPSR